MATTITKRGGSGATASISRRVAIGTHGADFDRWAGSWANCWGSAWHAFLSAGETEGSTPRVSVQDFLLLEGDESGFLLLEDGGRLMLEGDMVTIGGTRTKRVSEAVT